MKKSVSIILAVLLTAISMPAHSAEAFRVGAALRVVTPEKLLPVSGGLGTPNPTTQKLGDLFARAVVFEKGGTRAALVSLDFLGWPAVLGDRIRAQVKGVPPENILIGVTHTHSAPDAYAFLDSKGGLAADLEYLDWVCGQAAQAVNEAVGALQAAGLKVAVGKAREKIAYNYYAPELYDRRCSVMQAIAKEGPRQGAPIMTFVNYAIHPEVIGSDQGILSPDCIGPLYGYIEAQGGGMALFMNGAQGGMVTADCRGPDGKDIQTWDECVRIGERLGEDVLRLVKDAPVQEDPSLSCTARQVTFPIENPLFKRIFKGSPLNYTLGPDETVSTRVNLLDLGTAQLLTIPGEALPNIGFYLKRNMPTPHPFLLGLTNDAFGYMLAKVDWGSFERYRYISQTCLGEKTGDIYVEEALALLASSPKPDPLPPAPGNK